ncbi:MAG: hypothetical protein IH939_17055 [Acidobacteria bacterium]|nr:hypothetical protein [Acidobacteriota bacterium]
MSMTRQVTIVSVACLAWAAPAVADELRCDVQGYRAQAGLTADLTEEVLTLTWNGDPGQQVRLRLRVDDGTPTFDEIAVHDTSGVWTTVARDVTLEFRVVTGVRRMTEQQLRPLRALGVEITPELIAEKQWDAFWDAPLDVPGMDGRGRTNVGMPRTPGEIQRATAVWEVTGCTVATKGARLEVGFPGVRLGLFTGRLQITVYRGTNLIRAEVVARTNAPSVAYKYEAGLSGLSIDPAARVVWRDLSNQWQDYQLGGAVNDDPVPLKVANRIVIAETFGGTISAFPPPHTFFFAREVETDLGYGWYRKDAASFAFGVRQAEGEEDPRYKANFALYSARPGTWQRMAVYFHVGTGDAAAARNAALAFTRGDRFKALPGYQVMASHFHMDLGQRLLESGSLDTKLPDLEALKAAGITIVSPTDRPNGDDRLEVLAAYYEGARRHSDRNFLIMPNEEVSTLLGGHWDILFPKPVFWTRDRQPGQPFVERHPIYGTLYRVGSPEDVMEMVTRENALIYMPHPRTKGSTGYPDTVKDTAHFRHERYRGVGWRWGMGLDLSERRLSERRVLPLLDDMNNWMADVPTPPKQILAITETYRKRPGDDIYANNPVNYVKLGQLPTPDDMTDLIDALKVGDFFVTSGEVLIPTYEVTGTGTHRTIVADVEWTFPLDFVEVVWGDGATRDRQIIETTDLPPFGTHRFEIPFDATGKRWVRFAAWDSAGNGALVQPIWVE